MPHKSVLSDGQWSSVCARLRAGETAAALAQEFGVNESTVRRGAATRSPGWGRAQGAARRMAARLFTVSDHLAEAAAYGASTAHRLSALAIAQAESVASVEPEKAVDAIKRVQLLSAAANHAAEIGMNLMKAHKELLAADEAPTPVAIAFGVQDAEA